MNDLHETSGSYVLDALNPGERAEYEAHLATCEICQREVIEFGEAVAELSLLAEATPPETMRSRILDTIAGLPQLPAEDDEVSGQPSPPDDGRTGPRRAVPGSEVVDEAEPPPVDELAVRRSRRRSRVLSGLVAAMLALAVGLGGVVYTLVQERQAQIASQRLEDELLRAPDAKLSVTQLDGGGRVSFLASKQLNRAQFIGTDLPNPGQNRYQLWTGTGDPTGTITGIARNVQVPEAGGQVEVFFDGDIAQSDFLAVNLEPAGSTPDVPTNDPIAAGLT